MFLQFEILRNSTGLYTKIYPDYTDFKINIELKDTIYAVRYNPSGNIKIYKPTDFNLLKTILSEQKQAQIRVTNGTFNQNFLIDLEQSFKDDLQTFIGKLEILDDYSVFETKKDDKINIMGLSSIGDVYMRGAWGNRILTGGFSGTFSTSDNNYVMPEFANGLSQMVTDGDDASQDADNINILAVYFEITTDDGVNYTYVCNVFYVDYGYGSPRTYLKEGTINYSNFPTKTTQYQWYFQNVEPDFSSLTKRYTRVRDFFEAVQLVVQTIDSTVQFDNSGTDTDSFNFFKNFTGTSTNFFNRIGIIHITDAILVSGTEPTDGATIGYLTFSNLIGFLSKLGFFWYLENRSGINYFRLIHFTEISNSNGSLNLNYYKNVDYTRLANNYEFESVETSIINNEWTSYNMEWQGVSLDFRAFENKKTAAFSDETFFSDIDDVIINGSNKYNSESIDQFVILSLKDMSPYFEVYTEFGTISHIKFNNVPFSTAFLFKYFLSNFIDNSAILKGTKYNGGLQYLELEQNFDNSRLKKRKKIELTIPINQINSLSLQENVKFKGSWLEPEKIEVDCSKNQAKITLKDL